MIRSRAIRTISGLISACMLLISASACADKVYVAVASNFTAPAKELARIFQSQDGNDVILSFGSTGKLYTQIIHGAPFEVFLAADSARPERLEQEGRAIAGSRFTYATGQLALYSKKPLPDTTTLKQSDILAHLLKQQKVAIANPKTAPYGAAAEQILKQQGLLENDQLTLIMGDNIAQTFQFAVTGNVDYALVSQSQLNQIAESHYRTIPAELYSPIRQDAVLLKKGDDNVIARRFMAFLQSDTAQQIIQRYGYRL